MTLALLLVQLLFQLGGEIAAVFLLRQEQLDRQHGALLVGHRRALLRHLLGQLEQGRRQLGAQVADLRRQMGAQLLALRLLLGLVLGRTLIDLLGGWFGRFGSEQPGQEARLGGRLARLGFGQNRAPFALWLLIIVPTTCGETLSSC